MSAKTVLVAGASDGFGELLSLELARAGHSVFASLRSPDGADAAKAARYEAVARKERIALKPIALDAGCEESVDAAALRVLEANGEIDVVVHCSAQHSFGPTEAFTPEQLLRAYDVHAVGAHRVSRAVLPHMRERRRGLLVWITHSRVRPTGSPYLAPHLAATAALQQLATSYAAEIARFGIETAIISSGPFPTAAGGPDRAMVPADDAIADAYAEGPTGDLGEVLVAGALRLEPTGSDPVEVARTVRRLVDAPHGGRPFRTTVDPYRGGSEIAAAQDRLRADTLARLGLDDLHPSATE